MERPIRPETYRYTIWVAVFIAAIAGCSSNEAPLAYSGVTLPVQNLGGAADCPADAYVLHDAEHSRGRFPCALAIARLEHAESPDGAGWQVATMRPEEGSYWHTTFTAAPGIRTVVLLDGLSSPEHTEEVGSLAAATHRLEAGLCLVYGPAEAAPGEAARAGVLVETASANPIATIRAQAGAGDFQVPSPGAPEGDQRNQDVNWLLARKWERLVRRCVAELVARDDKPATTQPSPWQTTTPPPLLVVPARPGTW